MPKLDMNEKIYNKIILISFCKENNMHQEVQHSKEGLHMSLVSRF